MLSKGTSGSDYNVAIVVTLVGGVTMELRLAFLALDVLCLTGVALGESQIAYRVAVGPAEAQVIYSPDAKYTEPA